MKVLSTAFLLLAFGVGSASAMPSVADWSVDLGLSTQSATAQFNGITIRASTNADATIHPTVPILTNRFSSAGSWDAGLELPSSAEGLVIQDNNAGDEQRFNFLPTEGLFYIENFDSNSVARINARGATGSSVSLNLVSASSSITYNAATADTGVLSTSNSTFNGEGDAIFEFLGPVQEIVISYLAGDGDNAVMYTFAEPATAAVPEPTSLLVMGGLFGLFGIAAYRRKNDEE